MSNLLSGKVRQGETIRESIERGADDAVATLCARVMSGQDKPGDMQRLVDMLLFAEGLGGAA